MQRRVIETNVTEEDGRIEGSLRPLRLTEYIGQEKTRLLRSCTVLWTSWTWKDDSCWNYS